MSATATTATGTGLMPAGTRPLLRVTLGQDLRNIAPWVVLISFLSASSVLAYALIFPDPDDRTRLAVALGGNPALSLLFGPARDLMTADGFNAWRAGQLGALFAGLMGILIVVRNSRANEDSGQAELLASGVMARRTRLAVAVLMAVLAAVALGVLCCVVTLACGGGLGATLTLSGTFVASALVSAGVAAVTAQLGSDARTASTMAIATLGVLYVVRGYLDASNAPTWIGWLTPFGWMEKARPATGNHPLPLLVALFAAVALVLIAFRLEGQRDFGQGLVSPRPGPAEARLAGTVWGLALKASAGSLVGWLAAFTCLGLVFGNLASSVGDLLADNPAISQILASGALDSATIAFGFLATILQIIAIIAAVMGVQLILRIYSEEAVYRVEPLLAGSLRRSTYLASNVVLSLAATALALVLAGLTLGLVASAREDTISFGRVLEQAVATIPAVWVLVGIAVAVVGARPEIRILAWLGIVVTFGITLLGPTFNLPDWALGISPLHHVPIVVAASPAWGGLAAVAAVALLLLLAGFSGYRRRNIA